jgi:hypothetical protein
MHEYDIRKHLADIAINAKDWGEVAKRVKASYGEDLLGLAKEVAIEERGSDFYFSYEYEAYRQKIMDRQNESIDPATRKQTVDEMLFELEITKFIDNKLSVGADWNEVAKSVEKRFGTSANEFAKKIYEMKVPQKMASTENEEHSKNVVLEIGEEFGDKLIKCFSENNDKKITISLDVKTQELINQFNNNEKKKTQIELDKKIINEYQRYVLIATAFMLLLCLSYPPYQITVQGMTISQGFHWIWDKGTYQYTGVIEVPLLICELIVICLIGAISYKMASAKTIDE